MLLPIYAGGQVGNQVVTPATVAATASIPVPLTAAASVPVPSIAPAPLLRVLVAFTGTETDVTYAVRRLTVTQGRSRERETMSPGRAEITFWNFDGDFDPDNQSGPYFPNIRPNKGVRVLADVNSNTSAFTIGQSQMGGGDAFGGGAFYEIPLFTGRLEGGTLTYEEGGLQPQVTWQAIDASKRLNRDRSTTGFGVDGDLTGARVNAVLNGATPTWPATLREIAAGTRTVQAETGVAGRYDYMLTVAESELGAFFIGPDGKAIFRDATWTPEPATPALGSAADEMRFSSIEITDDEQEIYNAVTVSSPGLADVVREDTASQAEFGRSDLHVSTILQTTGDMEDLALTLVQAYSQPRRRISQLRVDRVASDWRFFLSNGILDKVIARHRPIYGGLFEQESIIQGRQVAVEGSQNWSVAWNLSPPLEIVSNPNLLTANQSSMETSTAGWTVLSGSMFIAGLGGGSVPLVGSSCLEVKSTDFDPGGIIATVPFNTAPVVVGQTYRVTAWTRSFFQSAATYAQIQWMNSAGGQISVVAGVYGGPWVAGTTEWVSNTVQGVAPAGAVYGRPQLVLDEIGAVGRPIYVDAVEFRHVEV